LQSSAVFIGYNLLYGLKGGVDNSAHIGGLVSGFVFGYILYGGIKVPAKRMATIVAMVVITVGLTGFYLYNNRDYTVTFLTHLERFGQLEEKALEPRKNLSGKTSDQVLILYKTISLPAWLEAKQEIDKTLSLKLTDSLQKERTFYIDYTNLRVKEISLLINNFNSDSGNNINEVDRVQASLDSMITLHNNLARK
jgi:rhomboid protease GluP